MFAQQFNRAVHLDIVFLEPKQESELSVGAVRSIDAAKHRFTFIGKFRQLLVCRVTGEAPPSTQVGGFRVYQDLTNEIASRSGRR